MSSPSGNAASRIVRFGVFEADLAAGELRKNGSRIRLQEQPFQVLQCLIERQGEVVKREELRQRLWAADTFVDFDHSLNTAINKIREALGDSASSPRFVETVARRGYRFLAPVEWMQPAVGPANASLTPPLSTSPPLDPDLEVPIPHRALTRSLFALIQVMYLCFYVAALFHLPQIDGITGAFLPGWGSFAVVTAVLVTAGAGIPLRCYLISATAFDYQQLGRKFQQMFLVVLIVDLLWAGAPFLIAPKIGFGAAFAATAALLYVPFSERTLIRLAYGRVRPS